MKVKSFVASLSNGFDRAIGELDGHVAMAMGTSVCIHKVIDTVYFTEKEQVRPDWYPRIVRVVVYDDRK